MDKLLLYATVNTTYHLTTGDQTYKTTASFELLKIPTRLATIILNEGSTSEDRLNLYMNWMINKGEHISNLEIFLKNHAGWTIVCCWGPEDA